jgi:hypothetical protein
MRPRNASRKTHTPRFGIARGSSAQKLGTTGEPIVWTDPRTHNIATVVTGRRLVFNGVYRQHASNGGSAATNGRRRIVKLFFIHTRGLERHYTLLSYFLFWFLSFGTIEYRSVGTIEYRSVGTIEYR